MFQVYTSTDKSELSKNLIGEFKDWDEAMDCAEQAIEGKTGIRYHSSWKKSTACMKFFEVNGS